MHADLSDWKLAQQDVEANCTSVTQLSRGSSSKDNFVPGIL